ncbi:hypothetical protein Clacol_001878 [Clathrus columnatus]|uniref:Uncharacterized protein n=1 Tax=Clathrus columnatus TaxID=1419009 RepID=A0AAV5A388_9AGAM|nr:hypothetical protein Clacol_001878 [Clathrus columnatus]
MTALALVEHPRLSTLKWMLSSLRAQLTLWVASMQEKFTLGLRQRSLVQLNIFIQNQATALVEHHSNLTKDRLSELMQEQAALFDKEPLTGIRHLRIWLREFGGRLDTFQNKYPKDADNLALLVAVYLQWSVPPPPPPHHPPLHEKLTWDNCSCVTGPRSLSYKSCDNGNSPISGGTSRHSQTGDNNGVSGPQAGLNLWLDHDTLKNFENNMEKTTWSKKMSSIANWVKEVPKDTPMFDVEKVNIC